MKTQVIQLDKHDDLISIRDKMSWSKSGRILLVFPRRDRLLKRRLDLLLLQRHALKLGAQLAIVARSEALREHAQNLGIPVFRAVSRAQRHAWQKSLAAEPFQSQTSLESLRKLRGEIVPTEAPWRSLLWVRLLFFSTAVLAVLVLLVLLFPSATIKVSPQTQVQSLSINVNASLETTSVNLAGYIPAHLASTVLQRMKTTYVSGSVPAPDKAASGSVTFRNLTDGTVGIPAGTVVRTNVSSPVRFATSEDAVLPGPAGETLEVPVKAVEGGTAGNLAADTLMVIEGDLGAGLAVTNPEPTSGGTDRLVSAQTETDRKRVHDSLQAEILEECKKTLQGKLAEGDLVFPDSLKISQEISETFFPPPEQSGDSLSLTMDVQCQEQYASAADLNRLAEMALDVNLPEGLEVAPGGAIAMVSGTPATEPDGSIRWVMQVQRQLLEPVNADKVAQLAHGYPTSVAQTRIAAEVPLESAPVINLNPSWWPWLPAFPFRITVQSGG